MTASARYHRVNPQYWQIARDWDERARVLGLYAQTCRHRTTEGYYELPKPYIAADLGWQAAVVDRAVKAVTDTGFVMYDDQAQVVFIPNALELQSIATERQVTGAVRRVRMVPITPLLTSFVRACEAHSNDLANALRNDLGDVIQMASSMGSINGSARSFEYKRQEARGQEA